MAISDELTMTSQVSEEDRNRVCRGLFGYNVDRTEGLLKKPGLDVMLVLKDERGEAMGGLFCDTFLYTLYLDVLWVDERYRGQGYGRQLLAEAERIAKEAGCIMAHTCTFSYQAPDFYQSQGYEVFGVLDGYPGGIRQYFLKKQL